eukprot:1910620-Rhodomonas_salina.5
MRVEGSGSASEGFRRWAWKVEGGGFELRVKGLHLELGENEPVGDSDVEVVELVLLVAALPTSVPDTAYRERSTISEAAQH